MNSLLVFLNREVHLKFLTSRENLGKNFERICSFFKVKETKSYFPADKWLETKKKKNTHCFSSAFMFTIVPTTSYKLNSQTWGKAIVVVIMLTLLIPEKGELVLAQKWENLEESRRAVSFKRSEREYFFMEVTDIPVFKMQSVSIKRTFYSENTIMTQTQPCGHIHLWCKWTRGTITLAFLS